MPLLIAFLAALPTLGQVRLPTIISNGMVVQRDVKAKIWGWAARDEKLNIQFNGKSYKTKADAKGNWSVWLEPMKAGGPYTLEITATNKLIVNDILIGDVWLCSGQSNMEYQLGYNDATYGKEMQEVNNPHIRQFKVPVRASLDGPKEEMNGGAWKSANPDNIKPFSAVAYFFAKKLYEKYHIPIGIINASLGGTPIDAWTSEDGLKDFPAIIGTIQKNKDTAFINSMSRRRPGGGNPGQRQPSVMDKGLNGPVAWYDTAYIPKGWKNISVPAYWEDQGVKDLNGAVWYRKEVNVPAAIAGKPVRVYLGRIVDADVLYINGRQIGSTRSLYTERRYNVPAEVLKAGKNLFVVKITNNNGKGGFVPDKPYYLFSGSDTIDLTGYWQYKIGEVYIPREAPAGSRGFVSAPNSPAALYNGMISPVINYKLKGFLWYQGETDINRAKEYAALQTAQITDWRKKWNLGHLPFLLVQLPNFSDHNYLPVESNWALMRESQLKALSVPKTGMAVTIDIGEWNDLHPWNKHDVGNRLALLAEEIAYSENIVGSGPLFQSATVDGNKIVLSFTHTGSGLITNDGEEPGEFAIAGADKKFVWASAKIEGDKIMVWSDEIPNPKYVRYAWAGSPVSPNLYNREGLPASPFRTDDF